MTTYTIKRLDGSEIGVSLKLLNQLRVLADCYLRGLGYDPDSVAAAWRRANQTQSA